MSESDSTGIDWDGDPVFSVNGLKAQVLFGLDSAFVRSGGRIALVAEAANIKQVGDAPGYVSTEVRSGVGLPGQLTLTTSLLGTHSPSKLLLRVRVPSRDFDEEYSVSTDQALIVRLP